MDFRSPADLTIAYASASSIQPHMPANQLKQNLFERALTPVGRSIFTKDQWDAMRPVILKLYLTEHKSFKQVVEILRKEYGFYPTENQFKKKINQWGFKKNFKGHELVAAIKGIRSQGNGQLDVKVGGFQVPDRRIKRVQQKQAKLKAATQHLIFQDYEEIVFDQADDKTTNFSPPLVPIQEIQGVQDAAEYFQNQEMEMDDVIELPTSSADDIDDVDKLLSSGPPDIESLCQTFIRLKIDINLEYWQNPLYKETEKSDCYLTENDLQNIFVPTNALSESPKTAESSESTELVIQSSSQKSPLIKPPDSQFIKVVLSLGTINTLSPFPNATQTSMTQSSSSGHRTTKWEQIGFELAKHKANLCKLVNTFGPENPGALHAMAELAYWYYKRYDYKSAEYLYTKIAYAYEKAFGLAHARTLQHYINVVESLYYQSKYLDAENIHNAFHPIILSDFGRTSELGIFSTRILADILGRTNRKPEAEELFRQNLQIQLNLYGPWHTETLGVMADLNFYYAYAGYAASSLECEQLSYTILQIQNAVLKFAEEDRPLELRNLAESQYCRGNFEKSIATFEKVAAQQKILLGVEHPETMRIQRRISSCLRQLGRFVECEELLQDTLEKELRISGEEHSNVFYTFWELGYTSMAMCCYGKAIPYLQKTVHIGLRLFDHDYYRISRCIQNLGFCYKEEGRHEEAVKLYYQHIERLHKVAGDVQEQISELFDLVLECIEQLGERYEASDNFQDALDLYYEHLERLLPNTGNNDEVVTTLSNWIVWNIEKLGEYYEDETCYQDALVLYYRHLEKLAPMIGKDHKEVEKLCNWIVWNIEKLGEYYEDETCYQDALVLYYRHLEKLAPIIGKDHKEVELLCDWIVWNVGNLGQSHEDEEDYEEALKLYQHHLEQLFPTLGKDHGLIVELRDWIRDLESESRQSPATDCVMEDFL